MRGLVRLAAPVCAAAVLLPGPAGAVVDCRPVPEPATAACWQASSVLTLCRVDGVQDVAVTGAYQIVLSGGLVHVPEADLVETRCWFENREETFTVPGPVGYLPPTPAGRVSASQWENNLLCTFWRVSYVPGNSLGRDPDALYHLQNVCYWPNLG